MEDSLKQKDEVQVSLTDLYLGQHLYTHLLEVAKDLNIFLPAWDELTDDRKEMWENFSVRIHYTR